MTAQTGPATTTVRNGGLFAVLVIFAGYTLLDSSSLMSNACIGETGQMVCPADGPDWARPLPAAITLLGLLGGLAGLLARRRARTPAMIAGFALVAVALVAGRLLAG